MRTPVRPAGAAVAGALLVAVLALVWFSPVLIGEAFTTVPTHQTAVYPWRGVLKYNGDKYAESDQADLNAPWQALETQAVGKGGLPLWNPDSFGGQPLFANGSSGVLYPLRLLGSASVSPTTTHTLTALLHVTLAGLFMYALLLDLGVSVPAALLGAVAWMFGTFTLDWIQLDVVAPVFAWLPAGCLSVRRSMTGSRRWIAATAAVIGVLLVGAHLPFAGVTCAAFLLYGALLAMFGERPVRRLRDGPWRAGRAWWVAGARRLMTVGASALLGVCLGAVTLLPTAALLADARRATFDYHTLVKLFLLAPSDLRYALVPPPHGIGASAAVHMHQAAFVGTATILFAVVGFFVRRPGTGLGRGLILASIAVIVGGPFTWIAYHLIPGMKVFRPYSRLLFVTDFGVAVLGAVGLDRALKRFGRQRPLRHGSRSSTRVQQLGFPAIGVAGVIVLGTALQLGLYGRGENPPFSRASAVYPTTPLLASLTSDHPPWPHRILPVRLDAVHAPMLFGDESLVFGIDSTGGYDSVVPVRTVELWQVSQGLAPAAVVGAKGPEDFLPTWEIAATRFDLLPRLGVDRVVAAPEVLVDTDVVSRLEASGWARDYQGSDGLVFRWTGAGVGPHVVGQAEVVHGDLAAMQAFTAPTFDTTTQVVLESAASSQGGGTGGQVLAARRGMDSAVIRLQSAGGWLVVPDMWDRGWTATVDGRSAPVLRANFNQQAVRVPPGTVTVRLRYRPPGLDEGLIVSGLALLVLLGLLCPAPRLLFERWAPPEDRATSRPAG